MERFDLKDALRSGVTPEQMMDDFAKQLATAQREVVMEKAAVSAEDLDEARADMIDAILVYLVATKLIDEDIVNTLEIADSFEAFFREAEEELAGIKPLLNASCRMMKAKSKERTSDDIIGEFLKSLK